MSAYGAIVTIASKVMGKPLCWASESRVGDYKVLTFASGPDLVVLSSHNDLKAAVEATTLKLESSLERLRK